MDCFSRYNIIRKMLAENGIQVKHIYREGNQVTDFFTNIIFSFAGTQVKYFNSLLELPNTGKAMLQLEKLGVPNIGLRKCQNSRGIQSNNNYNSVMEIQSTE